MEKLSEKISKKVISIDEGKCVGYVFDVCIRSDGSLYGLLICDDESEIINFLDINSIFCETEYIFIKNSNMLCFGENIITNNPIDKEVVSEKGECFGRVFDAKIDKKKLQTLYTEKAEINIKFINDLEKDYLFFSTKKRKEKNIFKKINDKINDKITLVNIQDSKLETKNESGCNVIQVPYKTNCRKENLLNRIVLEDIFGYNNELIIKKGQVINDKIIKKAKEHNKLNILFFNAK